MSLSKAILGLLTYGSMTGYDLKKIFDKSISQVWVASLSQIYRELSTLEKRGFVSSSIEKQKYKPDKRIYKITEEGKTAFMEWLNDFPEKLSFPIRDEFMLRIFFGSRLEKDQIITEFKRFILQKKRHLKTLKEIEKSFNVCNNQLIVDSPKKEELFCHLTIKRSQMTLEILIKWAEESIREIEQYSENL